MSIKNKLTILAAGVLLVCATSYALAAEVAGVKFDDSAKVAGKDLKLNGLGLRTKLVFKVYAAGLYLPEKSKSVADILKQEGPRRVTLVMMRDLSSEDFSAAFMDGLNDNVDKAEKSKLASQLSKMSAMFASMQGLKKGDVLTLDWVPGSGSVYTLNGKAIGDTIPDLAYYNTMLRIWLGDNPVDSSLKSALLGDNK